MQFIPTKWTFKQNCFIPFVQVYGESPNPNTLKLMLSVATLLIVLASKFKGKVITSHPQLEEVSANLIISFSLIFQDNIQLNNFIEFVHAQNID